jgi:CheY-like chemotaxis protein
LSRLRRIRPVTLSLWTDEKAFPEDTFTVDVEVTMRLVRKTPWPRFSVLLADDNRAMLADLGDELSKEFAIAGAVDNGEEAIREVVRLDPDILVVDITMPGLSGIQVASHLRDSHVRTRILFLTIQLSRHFRPALADTSVSAVLVRISRSPSVRCFRARHFSPPHCEDKETFAICRRRAAVISVRQN